MSISSILSRALFLCMLLLAPTLARAQYAPIPPSPTTVHNNINNAITQNGVGAITGPVLNSVLQQMLAIEASPQYQLSLTGDCENTLSVITCTKTAGNPFTALATLTPGSGVATALSQAVNSLTSTSSLLTADDGVLPSGLTLPEPSFSTYALAGASSLTNWTNSYDSSTSTAGANTLLSISLNGFSGGGGYVRSGDSASARDVIGWKNFAVDNNTSASTLIPVWAGYDELDIIAGTGFASGKVDIGHEVSVANNLGSACATINPYSSVGTTQECDVIRADSGVGVPAGSVSDLLHFISNGGNALAGIVFTSGAISGDSSGPVPAIAMAENHALNWYSSNGSLGWQIYYGGSSGIGISEDLTDTGMTISSTSGPTQTYTNTTNNRSLAIGVTDGYNGVLNVTGGGQINFEVGGTTYASISNSAVILNEALKQDSAAQWVATSNCGSLSSSTKCLAIIDSNGNTMYLPAYGTF